MNPEQSSNTIPAPVCLQPVIIDEVTEYVEEYTTSSPKLCKGRPITRRLNIALNKPAMKELHENIVESRDETETCLIYSNGLLLTTDGDIALLEDYNISPHEIHRQLGNDEMDDGMMTDEGIICISSPSLSRTIHQVPEKPKLIRENYVLTTFSCDPTPQVPSIFRLDHNQFTPVNLLHDFNMEV